MNKIIQILQIFQCLLMALGVCHVQLSGKVMHDRERIVSDIIRKETYFLNPSFIANEPTDLYIQLKLMAIDCIDQTTMDYSVTLLMGMTWRDIRLRYEKNKNDTFNFIQIDPNIIEKIWVPDIYFKNTKRGYFHYVATPNKLMHVFPDGRVHFNIRFSLLLVCEMNLLKFPFDSQVCHLALESYGSSANYLKISWAGRDPLLLDKNLQVPQFKLDRTAIADCTKLYDNFNKTWSCIRAELYISRTYGYYITQMYIPSAVVVCLSWVSFWLDAEATPARITLGLLTVLTTTTQSHEAKKSLPRVNYVKAIDVWMGMCLLFVFGALVEFAFVNFHARAEEMMRLSAQLHEAMSEYENEKQRRASAMRSRNTSRAGEDEKTGAEEIKEIECGNQNEYGVNVKENIVKNNQPKSIMQSVKTRDVDTGQIEQGNEFDLKKMKTTKTQWPWALRSQMSRSVYPDSKYPEIGDVDAMISQAKSWKSDKMTSEVKPKMNPWREQLKAYIPRVFSQDTGFTNRDVPTTAVDAVPKKSKRVIAFFNKVIMSPMNANETSMEHARRIDRMARLWFPLVFIIFNIFYWTFYMTWEIELKLGAAT